MAYTVHLENYDISAIKCAASRTKGCACVFKSFYGINRHRKTYMLVSKEIIFIYIVANAGPSNKAYNEEILVVLSDFLRSFCEKLHCGFNVYSN